MSNALGVATSVFDGYPLTERGRQQATALAESLSGPVAGGAMTQVFSSPVQRARETAGILATWWRLPVAVVPGLEEIHVGEHEGRLGEDVVRLGVGNWHRWLLTG